MTTEKQFNVIQWINGLPITESKKRFMEIFSNSDEAEQYSIDGLKAELFKRFCSSPLSKEIKQ